MTRQQKQITLSAVLLAMFLSAAAVGKPTAIQRSGPACPPGFIRSGEYCRPGHGSADKPVRPAIPRSGSTCPPGYQRSGEYCRQGR